MTMNLRWGPGANRVFNNGIGAALSGQSLSDSDNSLAGLFCLPKAGSINKIGFYIISENGASPAYKVGLVTIDSSGNPTDTAYGGSAIETPTFTAAGWVWVTLATPATAVAGEFAGVRIWPHTSAPDGTNYIRVASTIMDQIGHLGVATYLTSWAKSAGGSLYAIQYDDGTIFGNALTSVSPYSTINTGTTPDEIGGKFTVPVPMTVYGLTFSTNEVYIGSACTFTVKLYDAADNVLSSTTISDKDFVNATGRTHLSIYFAPINLATNTTYRITVLPTTGTNGNIPLGWWAFESAAAKATYNEGTYWEKTERTDAGAWTDTALALPAMALIVNDIGYAPANAEYGYVG